MKNLGIILLFGWMVHSQVTYSQNSYCNFIIGVNSELDDTKSHLLIGFRAEGLPKRDAKKVQNLITLKNGDQVRVSLKALQTYLSNVCRYKKYEIDFVEILKTNSGVYFVIRYLPQNEQNNAKQ